MTKKQIAVKLRALGFGQVEITNNVMSCGHSSVSCAGITIDVPLTHRQEFEWHGYKAVIGVQGKYHAGMSRNARAGRLMVRAEAL